MTTVDAAKAKSGRICFLDLLRIVCSFFVIVNHTSGQIFLDCAPSLTWFASLAWFFLSKAAVPIFLMISGYTLLERRDSYSKTIRRFLRYGCTIVVFSAVYYLADRLSGSTELTWGGFLHAILGGQYTTAYWYLYVYLGILLMLPLFQKLAAVLTKRDFHWMFFWSGLYFSLWPILEHYIPALEITDHFFIPLFNGHIVFLFLGYYFRKFAAPSRKWRIPCLAGWMGTVLVNVVCTYGEYLHFSQTDYLFFDNRVFLPVALGACCMFGLFAAVEIKPPFDRMITELGKLTFGIYLLSDLLIEKLEFLYLTMLRQQIHVLPAMLIYELAVFCLGAGITWGLRKIPGIRNLI